MIKANTKVEEKSKVFGYKWLLPKVKTIVPGLYTKVNLRISLHAAMQNYINLKQQAYESNDGYLRQFKFMVETLNIARGEHLLVSKEMLGKEYVVLTIEERNAEKEKIMAVCFILRSNERRYTKLIDDLKSSANRGRDEYLEILTSVFDLLVR